MRHPNLETRQHYIDRKGDGDAGKLQTTRSKRDSRVYPDFKARQSARKTRSPQHGVHGRARRDAGGWSARELRRGAQLASLPTHFKAGYGDAVSSRARCAVTAASALVVSAVFSGRFGKSLHLTPRRMFRSATRMISVDTLCALKASRTSASSFSVDESSALRDRFQRRPLHHFRRCRPSSAPTPVGISMPSTYHTARNGASISGQCSA
jgi:hypothetical protein